MRAQDKATITPIDGYAPHIGVLVDTLLCCRSKTIEWLKDLTTHQLDYLYDENANSIGALLLHLCALEVAVQQYSFQGIELENLKWKQKWGLAMYLGDPARREIRGHEVTYYLDQLRCIRTHTLEQLRQLDDEWLWREASWGNRTVNHYWMWYHVYEDEINHRGEISWLKSRIPALPSDQG